MNLHPKLRSVLNDFFYPKTGHNMSTVVEHLEKVLGDLVANRGRLVEQVNVQQQQIEVNQSQLEHFDTLIATVRNALGDAAAIAKIDELLITSPELELNVGQPSPLGLAGAGAANAPAPAATDGQGLPSQG